MTARSNSSLVGLLVVLALIGGALWFATRGSPTAVHETHERVGTVDETISSTATPSERAPDAERHVAVESAPSSAADAKHAGLVVLEGRVRRAGDHEPLAGLQVEIQTDGVDASTPLTLVTDSNGSYRREWPASVMVRRVRVLAGPETAAAERFVQRRITSEKAMTIDFDVGAGGRIAGRVVDEQGRAIAGAEVFAWCETYFRPERAPDRRSVSDANGAFTLEHVGPEFVLGAAKEGLVCVGGLRGRLANDASASALQVVMGRATTLRGIVVDDAARPLAGVALEIDARGSSWTSDATEVPLIDRFTPVRHVTTSGDDGRFEFRSVPDRALSVSAARSGFRLQWADVPPATEARIVMRRGSTVAGRVTTFDGQPAAGATVVVGSTENLSHKTSTDADGRFEVDALAPGVDGYVAVRASGNALFFQDRIEIDADARQPLEFHLLPPQRITGVVVDSTGRPIDGACVRIRGDRIVKTGFSEREPVTVESLLGAEDATTDAAGHFEFQDLGPGEYELRACRADEPELVQLARAAAGGPALELVIDRAALQRVVFIGRVIDAVSKAPVVEATLMPVLRLPNGMGRGRQVGLHDAHGEFRLAGYEPGRYELQVDASGYARWSSGVQELADGEHSFDVQLLASRALQASIRWRTARPARQWVNVSFTDAQDRPLLVAAGLDSMTSAIRLRETPTYVSGLPATLVRARIHAAAEGVSAQPIDIDLTRDEVPSIVFELDYTQPESETPRRYHFLAVWVADATDLDVTLERIGQLSHDGKAGFLEDAVELSFLDTQGREMAHGSFGAVKDGKRRLSFRAEHQKSESEGSANSMLSIDFTKPPASIRAACASCVERTLPFRASTEDDAFVLVALLRAH